MFSYVALLAIKILCWWWFTYGD